MVMYRLVTTPDVVHREKKRVALEWMILVTILHCNERCSWPQMDPYGLIWLHMASYGPIWLHMGLRWSY